MDEWHCHSRHPNCSAPLLVSSMCCQARSQESQLEFAHQQLDMRQQELRSQAAALEAAQHNTEQLHDTLHSLTEELNKIRQEAASGRAHAHPHM